MLASECCTSETKRDDLSAMILRSEAQQRDELRSLIAKALAIADPKLRRKALNAAKLGVQDLLDTVGTRRDLESKA